MQIFNSSGECAPTDFSQSVPWLAGLKPGALAAFAGLCQSKSLGEGQSIFREGAPCNELYILESGRVKCYRSSLEGREQVLNVFDRPGDTFCIASAFSTGRHIVSATAVTAARLYVLELDDARCLAHEQPSVMLKMLIAAGNQMNHLAMLAGDLSLKTVTARLAKLLYERAIKHGVRNGKEIHLRRDLLRQEELAALVGTVRVHISRALTGLVRAGGIKLSRQTIHIVDLALLERLGEER
ncbi:Crp/Fnr family transcriptional regulator [Sedimenticola hydrogenitrophicus]|uniref:Crp/Fnr family transcriptional regulator n=1 Tax=Sedimenticola hydrogenitrophicus TaxID=2967975 RepID=UPI0021A83DC6|nr:Crp/Fnr family transcriptional regulator [Sedimenticola hydrogenitrophicus]